MKLSQIKPNPKNPRLIKDVKFLKLVKSVLTFPEMLKARPIVIDNDNVILGGNMRYKALKHIVNLDIETELTSFGITGERLNYLTLYWTDFKKNKDVDVYFAKDLTPEQKDEFIIKDNVAFGENDWDVLSNDWDVALLTDWALDIPNFDTGILDESDYETKEPATNEKEPKKCPHCGEYI